MTQKKLNLTPLRKALQSLERALQQPKDEFIRDSVIQRFEYSYELSWKTLKRYFSWNQSLEIEHVRDIFREAGKQGLISSVEKWFEYHQARNLTSHIYSEEQAEAVYGAARSFFKSGQEVLRALEVRLNDSC